MNRQTLNRNDFRLFHRLRVRWAEVDMQKIVFNAHYLMYFDAAVTDYWRALALPYEEAMAQLGGDLYVRKASLDYHGSAHFDDRLDVALKCARIGNSSMVFSGAIFRGDEALIGGELVYVFADPATQTSRPVPPALRRLVECFEAGETVLDIQLGAWAELGQGAAAVRTRVFVQEQGIAREDEWDAADASALHAVACNALGQAVATGRLVSLGAGCSKLGRMAVHRALRGTRIGQEILQALVNAARRRGDTEVMLHAQRSAEGFYLRQGFSARGAPFDEVGIAHVEMVKVL